MPEIKTIKLKVEKRFTRENDEDFDLLCKCIYSVMGTRTDSNEFFIDSASGVDIEDDKAWEAVKILFNLKLNERRKKDE